MGLNDESGDMLQPYFQDEGVTIYCGDAAEVLPQVAVCDLLVTDPPYGVDFQSNRRQKRLDKIAGDDGTYDAAPVLDAALRRIGRGRHAYIFGPVVAGLPLTETVELIWDKQILGMGDLAKPWGTSHERITFGTYEPSKANRAKGYGRLAARLRKQSVIRCQRPTGAGSGRHPNEKPVGLLRELIESSSVMGEVVLDPFMGSGSTLVAARLEGRRAVGIEISERYCAIATERLRGINAAIEAAA